MIALILKRVTPRGCPGSPEIAGEIGRIAGFF